LAELEKKAKGVLRKNVDFLEEEGLRKRGGLRTMGNGRDWGSGRSGGAMGNGSAG